MSDHGGVAIARDAAGNAFRLTQIPCPICRTRDVKRLGMRGGEYQRHRQGVATEVVQCKRCDLIWPDPFPTPVDGSGLYGDPAKYFAHRDQDAGVRLARTFVVRRAAALSRVARPSLLDVGSGAASSFGRPCSRAGPTSSGSSSPRG